MAHSQQRRISPEGECILILSVGIIGLGAISLENVLGYLGADEARIVAVSDVDERKGADWLAKWKLPNAVYYRDYEDMLEAETLDIVEILTPHHLHCSMAVNCAEAGVKGISLQKPMATTLRECDEIIAACAANGVRLKVYENFVFYSVYQKAKELIGDGLIGEPISFRVNTMAGLKEGAGWPWVWKPGSWRLDPGKSGGGPIVGDDGFHKISLVRWFMGRDFEKVSAWIDADTPLDAPALVRARFRRQLGDGWKYAQIDFSFSPRMTMPSDFWLDDFVEIVGDRGIMWINQCQAAGDRELFRGNEMSASPVFPPIAVFVDGKVTTFLEKCPFLPGIPRNELISTDEMRGKIRAAIDGREDPSFRIIIRTDVIGTVSLDEYYREQMIEQVVGRSNAYADAIFVMALTTEEIEYYADRIKSPLVGIFATIEPIAMREFEKAGYQMVIGSLVSLYMAARGLVDGLKALKETGDWNHVRDKMIDDEEFFDIVGLSYYGDLYRRYDIP